MHTGWRWRYSVGGRPLPLKVAPIQRSVTIDFHLQSWRDSDCQMSEFLVSFCANNWMIVNELETNAMVLGPRSGPLNIHRSSQPIQTVSQNKYLGYTVTATSTLKTIDQSHRYGRHQAACREPARSYDKTTTRTAICFEHKTQYLLIRAPYTLCILAHQ